MQKWKKGERGFTLVELLAVIAIIGVLATLVLLQLGAARARARDTKRVADVAQLKTAIEQYYEDNNGKYPVDLAVAGLKKYFSSGDVPKDPLDNTKGYYYAVDATFQKFQVASELEQFAAALNSDSDIDANDIAGAQNGKAETCAASGAVIDCVYDQGSK